MILAQRADLGHGNVKKLLFSLSVPTITSQIVNLLYNLVDRVFIGHMQPAETVGKLALTGVGVCLPIIMIISAFASLMAIGGAPRASIADGAGESERSERIMGNCLTMLLITSLVLTIVFELFAEKLLLLFGASENTVGYALDYMRIYALGTVFVQLTLGMNAYITAQGFATVSMKTVLIGALLNIALDGKLSLTGVARGRKKGIKQLAEYYAKHVSDEGAARFAVIGNADCPKDADRLKEALSKIDENILFLESSIGPVIGSHVGPGMLAVVFWGKDRREELSVADRIARKVKGN